MSSKSPLQLIKHDLFVQHNLNVYVKRDDLIHPLISGNKWRKCHYLLNHLKTSGYKKVLTFGGAYSNHIHAFSYACAELGIQSIGIIRGDELANKPLNNTLTFAKENNMQLVFVSREEYQKRNDKEYIKSLEEDYSCYVVPEGGSTRFAIDGFNDMLDEIRHETSFNSLFVPCGSGGTIAGINANLVEGEQVYGINVLKGTEDDIESLINDFSSVSRYQIITDYHFGGYAKSTSELKDFMKVFELEMGIEIESVYSAKMFFGFFDMVKKNKFNNESIVLCHTGGLQGKQK